MRTRTSDTLEALLLIAAAITVLAGLLIDSNDGNTLALVGVAAVLVAIYLQNDQP